MEADSAPLSHPHGSGGVQRGRTVGSAPLGRFFWYFSARGRKVHFSTVGGLHGVRLPRPKNSFFKKTPSADVRRVHFSTVGGLHGKSPPRQKNSFLKNAFRRRSASTLLHRRWPARRAPAKAKELFYKNASRRRYGVRPPRAQNLFCIQAYAIRLTPAPLFTLDILHNICYNNTINFTKLT